MEESRAGRRDKAGRGRSESKGGKWGRRGRRGGVRWLRLKKISSRDFVFSVGRELRSSVGFYA
jgi:hypothetical protein